MSVAERVASWAVRNRERLPAPLRAAIDRVAKSPDGLLGRAAAIALGGGSRRNIPAPTAAPSAPIRVYIGPTNYAGQGRLWAAALERADARIGARNVAVEVPGGFAFPADSLVPLAVASRSREWQQAELKAVDAFTHVLVEAERPLFGTLFHRDVAEELRVLAGAGVSLALLSHGTDLRDPRRHLLEHRWSPYRDDPQTPILQSDADNNRALIESAGLPVFVSTPDLLAEAPFARWCPVVVDPSRWSRGRGLFTAGRPVVVHIPSRGHVKGSELIEGALHRLHTAGVIEYRAVAGVASAEMPAHIRDADIVLDQFRLGSYGVAACEGLAAGRVVVGNVDDSVREAVARETGSSLPIVQADPDSLESVLRAIASDEPGAAAAASAGPAFVAVVHDGTRSAAVLIDHWIGRDRN